jgi:hypothetical protein
MHSFAFVQLVYQQLRPGIYWGSELCYCILSLVAKLWLGIFILVNVIITDVDVEASLSGLR